MKELEPSTDKQGVPEVIQGAFWLITIVAFLHLPFLSDWDWGLLWNLWWPIAVFIIFVIKSPPSATHS